MVRRRGTPRRRILRERTYRTRAKWDPLIAARRYKVLVLWKELDWELYILGMLESDVYTELTQKGIPSDQWEPYRDFAFRLWACAIKFTEGTYALERTSLINEFTSRGLNPTVLSQLVPLVEEMARFKLKLPPRLGNQFIVSSWPVLTIGSGERGSLRFTAQKDYPNCNYIGVPLYIRSWSSARVGIQKDDGLGRPSGTYLTSQVFSTGAVGRRQWELDAVPPCSLIKGEIYHIVMEFVAGTPPLDLPYVLPFQHRIPYDSSPDPNYKTLRYAAGAWTDYNYTPIFIIGDSAAGDYMGQPYSAYYAEAVYGNRYRGEEWTQEIDVSVKDIALWVRRLGTPPNNLLVSLWDKTAGAYVLQDMVFLTPAETPTSFEWITKRVETPFNLVAGKVYQLFARTIGGAFPPCYDLRSDDAEQWNMPITLQAITWKGTDGKLVQTNTAQVPLELSRPWRDFVFCMGMGPPIRL